jgi:hypothetical protein
MSDDRKAPLRSVPRPRRPTTRGGCGLRRLRQLGLPTVLSGATPLAYVKNRKRPAMERVMEQSFT